MKKALLRNLFGARVRQLREASGISQETFADRCGIARSYMSRVERGLANPSLDAIERLAGGLGVEVTELFRLGKAAKVAKSVEILVPYANDGTFFHEGLRMPADGKYLVGEKEDPTSFDSYEEALAYLRSMGAAKWRRPNVNGNWGLVTAVCWKPPA